MDGENVGLSVGEPDGVLVGSELGCVGSCVGPVGSALGLSVGTAVGLRVCACVVLNAAKTAKNVTAAAIVPIMRDAPPTRCFLYSVTLFMLNVCLLRVAAAAVGPV